MSSSWSARGVLVLSSVTGGGVTSWQKAAGSAFNSNIEIWYGVVSTSSAGVTIAVTATPPCPTNGTQFFANVTEWSGLVGTQSQLLDTATAMHGSPSSASAPSITTLNAADLVIFGVSENAGSGIGTLGAPWTAMATISTGSQIWSNSHPPGIKSSRRPEPSTPR